MKFDTKRNIRNEVQSMKILIWFLTSLAYAIIVTVISSLGITLGGLATGALALGAFLLARVLCLKWDEHKSSSHENSPSLEPVSKISISDESSLAELCTPDESNLAYKTDSQAICHNDSCSQPGRNYKKPFIACSIISCVLIVAVIILSAIVISQNRSIAALEITVQQKEKEKSEKYSEGYDLGVKKGQTHGYNNGFADGYDQGLSIGYKEGYCTGYGSAVVDYADSATRREFLVAMTEYLKDTTGDDAYSAYYSWIQARRKYIFGR